VEGERNANQKGIFFFKSRNVSRCKRSEDEGRKKVRERNICCKRKAKEQRRSKEQAKKQAIFYFSRGFWALHFYCCFFSVLLGCVHI
jgi:hypothetical protein